MATIPNALLTGPTIVSAFGFDTNQSTLLNMGSGSAQVAGTFLALFIAKHTNRTIAGLCMLGLAILGVIMMLAIPAENYGARYGGYILMSQCQ
jgi:ACS family allantoate permease-like MFS transporter